MHEEPGEAHRFVDLQAFRDRRPAQVGFEDEDAESRLGQREAELAGGEASTFAGRRARHEDDLLPATADHQLYVGAQLPESLGVLVVAAVHDERRNRPVAAEDAENGRAKHVLELPPSPDPRIEGVPQQGGAQAQHEADLEADQEVEARAGGCAASNTLPDSVGARVGSVPCSIWATFLMN